MTTEEHNGREWTLRCGYRRDGRRWKGYVYWNPDWVAMNLDGISSRLVWKGHALTEKRLRHKLARVLRSERRRTDDRNNWFYRGKRAEAADAR